MYALLGAMSLSRQLSTTNCNGGDCGMHSPKFYDLNLALYSDWNLCFSCLVKFLKPDLRASSTEKSKARVKDTQSVHPSAAVTVTTSHSVRAKFEKLGTHSQKSHCF